MQPIKSKRRKRCCLPITAPSFNGRTADSGSAYRGSNPWGAAKSFQQLTFLDSSPKPLFSRTLYPDEDHKARTKKFFIPGVASGSRRRERCELRTRPESYFLLSLRNVWLSSVYLSPARQVERIPRRRSAHPVLANGAQWSVGRAECHRPER